MSCRPARPAEFFALRPRADHRPIRPPLADATPRAGEVARLLARRAALAGKLDDLRQALEPRKDFPSTRESARRVLAAIEEAGKE